MRFTLSFLLLVFSFQAISLDWQGHRGARGLYPENTIGAMEEALKFPITTLEFDVVLSKNLEIIVSHEPWMSEEICLDKDGKRFKGKIHNIFRMTYEEIATYDCGSIPHPRFPEQKNISTGKPTLEKLLQVTEELLAKLNRTNLSYNIEIKSTPEDERAGYQPGVNVFSDTVIKFLKSKLPVERFTIQSFDWRVLKYIHKNYPDVRLVALIEKKITPEKNLKDLGFNPFVFSPYYKDLSKEHVQFFHDKGIKVIPWTVNGPKEMEAMIALGVDGIITDYPDRISQIDQRKCKKNENLFEGDCVTVPENALPSESNPGWVCKAGYVQKRLHCLKIELPEHAILLPDGKSWECIDGYVRYRTKCKKK
jgi:glycerophosphoryl diester phosphodiesterase